MKAIKALVIFMGLLIVIGLGVLGWGVMRQGSPLDQQQQPPATPVAISPAPLGEATAFFETVRLAEPPGSTLQAASLHGTTLVLTITGGGMADRVVLFHLPTARASGRIVISE